MLKIYRSSAGSGKTFTLVKEYLQICMKSKEVDKYRHILAITFTNKACNEMKDRIIRTLVDFADGVKQERDMFETLQKEYGLAPDYIIDYSKKMLDAVLQDYSSFSISTIDSFIHRVIRSFAYELDIPHQFEVHMDKDELIENVIGNLLDEISETADSPIVQSLLSFADHNMEEGKGWNIDYALSQFAKELLKENNLAYLNQLAEIDYDEIDKAQKRMQQFVMVFEKKIHQLGEKAKQLIHNAGVSEEDFYYGSTGIPGYVKRLSNFNDKILLGFNTRQLKAIEEDIWYSGKKDNPKIDSIKEQLRAIILESQAMIQSEGKKYYLFQIVLSNIFQIKVADGISKALQKVKEDENILPILEFQHIISKIVSVQDAPVIYERIGEKYDNILIDEFQDTSTLQFRNLLPLIENSQFKSAESLIVGDAKQSIYRFKGGEAMQLVELPNIFGSDDDDMLKAREVAINNYPTKPDKLSSNFRSKREIIEFNNKFYDCIKNTNESLKRIYHEHEQQFREDKTGGFVSIEKIENEEDEVQEKKLERILEIISECNKQGYGAGDIAILTRDNRTAVFYAEHLLTNGYEVETSESLLFIDSPDVQLIEALIKYCASPHDKIARFDLLKHSCLDNKMNQDEVKVLLKTHVHAFDEKIAELIDQRFETTAMMHFTPYQLSVQACRLFHLNTNDAFVTGFIDLVADSGTAHAVDFVEWWNEIKTKKSIQINSKANAVKIMTLHKCKGLQFPVVIIPDTDWAIKQSNHNAWITDNEDIGISPMLINISSKIENTDYTEIYEEEKLLSEIDTVNLLYVGTTRPEDRLYILFQPHKVDKDKFGYADKYLQHFLSSEIDSESDFTFGDANARKQSKSNKAKSDSVTKEIATIHLEAAAKPNLKTITEVSLNEEQLYGNCLHELLSRVAENGIEYSLSKIKDSDAVAQQLKADIHFIMNHPELNKFFTDEFKLISEFEILSDGKRILKPDLIAVRRDSKSVSVLDYKSGKPMQEHRNQVNDYASLLIRNGYEVEEKLIVYTQLKEVKRL